MRSHRAPLGLSEWVAGTAVGLLTVCSFLAPRLAGAPPPPMADVGVVAVLGAFAVRLATVGHRAWAAALATSALVWAVVGVAPLMPADTELVVSRWSLVPLAIVVAALATRATRRWWLWSGCSVSIAAAAGSGLAVPALLGFGCLLLAVAGTRWRSLDSLSVSTAALGLGLVALDQRVLGDAISPPLLTITVDVVLVAVAATVTWSLTEDHRAHRALEPTGDEGEVTRWLARSVGRPTLSVAFPGEGATPVDLTGQPVALGIDAFPVRDQRGRLVAYLSSPPREAGMLSGPLVGLLASLGDVARMRRREMDQAREVTESRRRLQAAADEEARSLQRQLDETVMRRLATLRDLVADSPHAGLVARVDQVAEELRRHALGLDPLAGRSLSEAFATHAGHGVDVAIDASITDPAAARTAWYVATEALSNAAKHASGAAVSLNVGTRPGWVDVVVTDQGGGGVDPSGAGLVGLVDRVEAGGGSLRLTSGPAGTTVTARIPYHPGAAHVPAATEPTSHTVHLSPTP